MTFSDQREPEISWDDFLRVEMRIGRVLEANLNPKANVPAYRLRIDFGPEIGQRESSAQLTKHYAAEELPGRLVVAVLNFPPKRVAGVKSEVLVLGAVGEEIGVVLLTPTMDVPLGSRIA